MLIYLIDDNNSTNSLFQGDKLYSIKWYRNGHEFYRYLPTDSPKTTVFNGDGITVDVSTN